MIDRDQLREALGKWDRVHGPNVYRPDVAPLVEAARLVADPDTLVITKVDGEWPIEAVQAFIADQRSKDWSGFHPEDYCHRCGRPNISWYVASEEWNLALRDPQGHPVSGYPGSEIVCPQCFVEGWEAVTGVEATWELRIDRSTDRRSLDALLEGQK